MTGGVINIPIAEVRVGTRCRKDLGDLSGLAASMAGPAGLLQPIGLDRSNNLVFGGRRLAAAKLLGWEAVPARVFDGLNDATAALVAERDENTCRMAMTKCELIELGRAIEALERPAAKERQKEHGGTAPGRPKDTPGNLPAVSKGDTRDKVAAALNLSGRSYEKGRQVMDAAESDPASFGDLPEVLNRSVDAAHRELIARQKAADAKPDAPDPAAVMPTMPPPVDAGAASTPPQPASRPSGVEMSGRLTGPLNSIRRAVTHLNVLTEPRLADREADPAERLNEVIASVTQALTQLNEVARWLTRA